MKNFATVRDRRVLGRFRDLFGKNFKQNDIYAVLLDNGLKPVGRDKYGQQLFVYGSDDDMENSIDTILNNLYYEQQQKAQKNKQQNDIYPIEDYTPKESNMRYVSDELLKQNEISFDDKYDDELYESLFKKTVYITENQYKTLSENITNNNNFDNTPDHSQITDENNETHDYFWWDKSAITFVVIKTKKDDWKLLYNSSKSNRLTHSTIISNYVERMVMRKCPIVDKEDLSEYGKRIEMLETLSEDTLNNTIAAGRYWVLQNNDILFSFWSQREFNISHPMVVNFNTTPDFLKSVVNFICENRKLPFENAYVSIGKNGFFKAQESTFNGLDMNLVNNGMIPHTLPFDKKEELKKQNIKFKDYIEQSLEDKYKTLSQRRGDYKDTEHGTEAEWRAKHSVDESIKNKKMKKVYITESQYDNLKENNWRQEFYNTHIKNGFIKLYHNTSTNNLDSILNDGEIKCNMHHSEGHGDMLWFTVKDDDYTNQVQISITVDEETFKKEFKLMNSIHAVTYSNLPIDKFNFKIEEIEGLTYDRVMEILSEDDNRLIKCLAEDLPASVWNWFLEKYDSVNSLNESMNFIEPEKVKIVKRYLDNNFKRAKMPIVGEDGYPKMMELVGMIGADGNICKNMTAQQLFYLLQDKFQHIYSDRDKRDKFLKQIIKDWYNNRISKEGLLSVNKY